ncbi:hypothetical protein, partial [Salmonella enterica]|uniref:hypothetical protein n=1 Tax=Salmonella enterica TaxID=28901 RepID=UPI001F41D4EF
MSVELKTAMTVKEVAVIPCFRRHFKRKPEMGLQNFRHPAIGPFVGLFASDSTIRDGTSEDEKKPYPFDSDTVFLLHRMFKNTLRTV